MPTIEPQFVSESSVEQALLAQFEAVGYSVVSGPSISPGEAGSERESHGDVCLSGRLAEAIERLNPNIPYNPDFPDRLREVA